MNIFKSSFDELNYGHGYFCTQQSEALSSSSETSSYNNISRGIHDRHSVSDEEVILASARPKKRAGRRVFNETRHPVYRGVRKRNKNKWVCEMRVPNNVNKSRIWLGTYPTPEMAARAHDVAALALRGKSACLNFADSAWRLTLPASTDAEEIRRAATEAAELFAAEEEDNININININQQQQSSSVCCSVGDDMAMGDDANNMPMQMQQQHSPGMYVDVEQVPAVSEFEEWHDLLLGIADGPLMSPSPSARDGRDWHDVEIFDTEVSLWNFSI